MRYTETGGGPPADFVDTTHRSVAWYTEEAASERRILANLLREEAERLEQGAPLETAFFDSSWRDLQEAEYHRDEAQSAAAYLANRRPVGETHPAEEPHPVGQALPPL